MIDKFFFHSLNQTVKAKSDKNKQLKTKADKNKELKIKFDENKIVFFFFFLRNQTESLGIY